jgi:hypothetical protein
MLPPPAKATLGSTGLALSLPPASRSIAVFVAASTWVGVTLVPSAGPVSVLALPLNAATPLAGLAGSLGGTAGPSMGVIDSGHAVVVAGPLNGEPQTGYVIDLGTGSLSPLLGNPGIYSRDFATVTPFEGGFLVAGGRGVTSQDAITAEAFKDSPENPGGFVQSRQITLSLLGGRVKHGAVMLPSGDVLLAGGEDPTTGRPIEALEIVSPGATNSTPAGALKNARVSPTVLSLPTGNLLIGGGVGACDTTGAACAVSTVEWFSSSVIAPLSTLDLCASLPSACCPLQLPPAFAPLEGGGVLVALVPHSPLGQASPACSNLILLHDDFTAERAPLGPFSTPPVLLAGARSRPVLLADGAWRWNPWGNSFEPLPQAAVGLSVPVATASPEAGLALWLGNDDRVWALRFDTRNEYATDLLATTLNPSEFAPDRLVNVRDSSGEVDVATGKDANGSTVTLQGGAGIFLTDATFLDVAIDFTFTGQLSLVLRDADTGEEFALYPGNCLPSTLVPRSTLRVERMAGRVTAGLVGEVPQQCATAPASGVRVAVGFRAPPGGKGTVGGVMVQRLGSFK